MCIQRTVQRKGKSTKNQTKERKIFIRRDRRNLRRRQRTVVCLEKHTTQWAGCAGWRGNFNPNSGTGQRFVEHRFRNLRNRKNQQPWIQAIPVRRGGRTRGERPPGTGPGCRFRLTTICTTPTGTMAAMEAVAAEVVAVAIISPGTTRTWRTASTTVIITGVVLRNPSHTHQSPHQCNYIPLPLPIVQS